MSEFSTTEDGSKGSFLYTSPGGAKAEMSYSKAGDTMLIIDHTEVSDDLRGQGIGEKLARYMVEEARRRKLKIIPLCPFAKSVFDKNPELMDVLR